jgi:hypothetical protein
MNVMRKAVSALGGIFLAALLIAALAPKATRGVAAALVQIVPGTTTHVGQNESQLVFLVCQSGNAYCNAVDPTAEVSTTPYVVPSGFTLIVTYYQWNGPSSPLQAGTLGVDVLFNPNTRTAFVFNEVIADANGSFYAHEYYPSGFRVGSGVTIADANAAAGNNVTARIQGYLVPND